MTDTSSREDDFQGIGATAEETDGKRLETGFGEGGVPWYLLCYYLAFLIFFTWYVLEYQLPDFEQQGPVKMPESVVAPK